MDGGVGGRRTKVCGNRFIIAAGKLRTLSLSGLAEAPILADQFETRNSSYGARDFGQFLDMVETWFAIGFFFSTEHHRLRSQNIFCLEMGGKFSTRLSAPATPRRGSPAIDICDSTRRGFSVLILQHRRRTYCARWSRQWRTLIGISRHFNGILYAVSYAAEG